MGSMEACPIIGGRTLTDAQRHAVRHREGPALVLAGPGSGKTTVIVTRIALLANSYQNADRLLSVTFSRAAGKEMAKRYARDYPTLPMPCFCTVHSLCNTIIREYKMKYGVRYQRLDEMQQRSILQEIYWSVNGNLVDTEMLERLIGWISRVTNRLDSDLSLHFEPQVKRFPELLAAYQQVKRDRRLIDFDDMILWGRQLLQQESWLCERWSHQYDYIQVDEGQDLSRAQFDVIRLLSSTENLFVVADDDQGIYGFRGADPRCVLEFEQFYPNCKKYYLEENHRSCGNVVDLASQVVATNQMRYEKHLYTKKASGAKIHYRSLASGGKQALFVAQKVRRHCPDSVGILYRNNLSGMLIALAMQLSHLPYRFLSQPAVPLSFPLVQEAMENIQQKEAQARGIVPTPYWLFTKLVGEGFFQKWLRRCEVTGQQKRYVFSLMEFLLLLCHSCATVKDCLAMLGFIGQGQEGQEGQEDDESGERQVGDEHIVLSTVHSAKGLEFDVVFIVDLLQDEFPGNGSSTGELLEEERRLFYVALTRAKKELYLLFPRSRAGKKQLASMFFEEAWKCNYSFPMGNILGNNCQDLGNKVK